LKKIFLLNLLVSLVITSFAQRVWIESEFTANILKKLELSVAPEVRFNEGFKLNEYFAESGLEYEFHEYFQLGAGYRFGFNINKKDEHESFGRFHIDAKTGIKLKNFNPKIRMRFTNADDFGDDNKATNYMRYKLELEYKIKKLQMEPYLLHEWYHDLDVKDFIKTRFEGGFMHTISKRHKIGAYFRIHKYLKSDKETVKIIGLAYKFDL
jgi:hypothetical protein